MLFTEIDQLVHSDGIMASTENATLSVPSPILSEFKELVLNTLSRV